MAAPEVEGIDLFKIAGRSISGWVPSLKTGTVIRQPFCSQLEERLLLWLEHQPLVASYARGDIDPQFATTYRLPIPQHAPENERAETSQTVETVKEQEHPSAGQQTSLTEKRWSATGKTDWDVVGEEIRISNHEVW
jgi:hypothetical protein